MFIIFLRLRHSFRCINCRNLMSVAYVIWVKLRIRYFKVVVLAGI